MHLTVLSEIESTIRLYRERNMLSRRNQGESTKVYGDRYLLLDLRHRSEEAFNTLPRLMCAISSALEMPYGTYAVVGVVVNCNNQVVVRMDTDEV